jgi:regulator of sigma D
MSIFNDYETLIQDLLKSEDFKKTVSGDVLVPIASIDAKQKVVQAALRCIFGGPQGVRKMPETKDWGHIKNNKNWRPFCQQLLDYLKKKGLVTQMEGHSSVFSSFKQFWPDCENDLQKAVAESQSKK